MAVRSLKDAVMTITDGAAASITVTIEDGDIAWTERHPANIISDRGVLDHARAGNEEPVELSFSVLHAGFASGNVASGTVSLYEMLTKTGGASGYTSDEPNSDVWAVVIAVAISDPAGGATETLTFARFIPEEISFQEGDPSDTLSCSGRAVITAPTIT